MKVLVTGACGFIGSNLVRYLRSERPTWQIVALDLLTYAGNLDNIRDLLDSEQVKFVKADISDAKAIRECFKSANFDLVFNLAAESHVDRSIHDASGFVQANIVGTQVLLDAAREAKVRRYVQISTDEVYGSLGPEGRFVETTPLDPTSPYAASKAAADLLVQAYFKTHKFDCCITRCTNNYGPYQFPEKLIPLFITNAFSDQNVPLYGDGMNVRSWVHVLDHCEALLAVAERGKAGEVYNVGCPLDSEVPNIEVTKRILKLMGKPESLIKRVADRPAHDRRYAVDHSKLTSELGWQPHRSFEQGLKDTINWYLQNESWWQSIKSGEYLKFYDQNYSTRLAEVAAR